MIFSGIVLASNVRFTVKSLSILYKNPFNIGSDFRAPKLQGIDVSTTTGAIARPELSNLESTLGPFAFTRWAYNIN
jgi:hypothetical protein